MNIANEFTEFFYTYRLFRSNNNFHFLIDQPNYIEYGLSASIQKGNDQVYNAKEKHLINPQDKVMGVIIYSINELKVIGNLDNTLSDKIIVDNIVYEIISSSLWRGFGDIYYKNHAIYYPEQPQTIINMSVVSPVPLPNTPPEIITPLFIANEVMTGVINGVNVIFSTLQPYLSTFLNVYLNGKRLILNDEYIELSDNSIQIVALDLIPISGDILTCDYWVKI